MRAESKKFLRLLRFSVLSTILASTSVFADDDARTGTANATNAPKLDAPKPGLSERERWLLDKVEQLEKRVAELESKTQTVASSTASAASPATATTPVVPFRCAREREPVGKAARACRASCAGPAVSPPARRRTTS